MLKQDLLLAWGATFKKYKKDQCIFFQGDTPLFYFEVVEGSVRMANIYKDGREFIQQIFKKGESFGESVLLINEVYPATAVANASTIIIRITKENFMKIISEYPDVHHSFTCLFASRLFDMA